MWRLPDPYALKGAVVTALGDRYYDHKSLDAYIDHDFQRCLLALEGLYHAVPDYRAREVAEMIQGLLSDSELDLDVRWRDGSFYPAGARELDESLVNHNLDWLSEQGLETVLAPYRKGLRHFLEAQARPELLNDVVTDMYEAFEAMLRVVTGRNRADRETREVFLNQFGAIGLLGLSQQYVEYAHSFRHADDPVNRRTLPTEGEVEAFVYLTGVFLRLASRIRREGG